MAVQVHRVDLTAAVLDGHLYDVALLNDEHRDVRELVAVDGPDEAGLAVEQAGAPADRVDETAGRVGGVKRQLSWCAVVQLVELGTGVVGGGGVALDGPDGDAA